MLDQQFAEAVDGLLRQFFGELDALDDGAESGGETRCGNGHVNSWNRNPLPSRTEVQTDPSVYLGFIGPWRKIGATLRIEDPSPASAAG